MKVKRKINRWMAYTRKMAMKHRKPRFHADLNKLPTFHTAMIIDDWISKNGIQVLNVSSLIELQPIAEAEELQIYFKQVLDQGESAARIKDKDLDKVNRPFDVVENTYKHLMKLCDDIIS